MDRVLAGHPHLEIAAVFAFVFFAFYFIRVSYAWSMASMSALFASLYALLGRLSTSVLVVRLEETLVGAACGALVASLLLPAKTSDRVRVAAATVLHATAERLRALAEDARVSHSRQLEFMLQKLREAARPTAHALTLRMRSPSRLTRHVAVLVFATRHLAATPFREAVSAIGERADILGAIAQMLEGNDAVVPPRSPVTCADLDARYWLARLDGAIDALEGDHVVRAS